MLSSTARRLRSNPTEAEKRLWARLRHKRLDDFRFRRQAPIGPYIVDFFCPSAKLVVELDGGQHGERSQRDAAHTRWLEKRGYRVIRFWNTEVFENFEGGLARLWAELAARG